MKSIYEKNPDFVQREVAGEFILIPIKRNLKDSNDLFILNEVGAAVWKQFDGKSDLGAIKDKLLSEFDVTENHLEQDLKALVTDLLSIQAILEKSCPQQRTIPPCI